VGGILDREGEEYGSALKKSPTTGIIQSLLLEKERSGAKFKGEKLEDGQDQSMFAVGGAVGARMGVRDVGGTEPWFELQQPMLPPQQGGTLEYGPTVHCGFDGHTPEL